MDVRQACDIIEIQQVLAAYLYAIDVKDYDRLDAVFTPDCTFEYIIENGRSIKGEYPQIKNWISRTLADFPITQHLIGLPQIIVNGDKASATSMLFNPMQLSARFHDQLFFVGGTYRDRLVRTADGWRISDRQETGSWTLNPPEGWTAPALEG